MSALFIVLAVVFALTCLALIGAILLQKKRDAGGVGSIAGMGNVSESYMGKTTDGKLEFLTKVGGAAIGVLAIVLCLV